MNRVVITDMNQLSVCGDSLDNFWAAILLENKCYPQINQLTNKLCFFVSNNGIYGNRYEEFLRITLIPLLRRLNEEKINLIVGSSFGENKLILEGTDSLFPSHDHIEKILKNKLSFYCNLSTACTSSLNAVGYGYNLIKRGELEHVIVGGCEVLDDYVISGMDVLRVLSKKEMMSPFSKNRDGAILGEGSAFLTLKSLDYAIKTKSKILAEIIGYSNINDAHGPTKPDLTGWGLINSMKNCLVEGNIVASQVAYVNSHGSGTYYNDLMETNALKALFGHQIITSTIKPIIGHTLGACGALETLACIFALQHQIIPPTYTDKDALADTDIDYCANKPRYQKIDYILKNSVGFWGSNASILLKKYKENNFSVN